MNAKMKIRRRWYIFLQQRFPPAEHALLIVFYFGANAMVAGSVSVSGYACTAFHLFLGLVVVGGMFFHLRIFDEIKDFRHDCTAHPDRPLARGLLSVRQAKQGAGVLIVIELLLSALIGVHALSAVMCTALYSLVMYKEFFIGQWLRPRLATYALTHTLVACLMSLCVFSIVTGRYFWMSPKQYALFVCANWMIFNVFEFGRKTFAREEERDLVDSYSKRLGSIRAAGNVIGMAAVAVLIAVVLGNALSLPFLFYLAQALLLSVVVGTGLWYGISVSRTAARAFRGACSVFILLYNVIIVIGVGSVLWR
ncbi:MAG: manganese transporter permease [Candidatus Omnitrophica bacterium]|nr:manganese transporter permease [Candidatus Omnitrophota bacterium]